LNKENTMSLNLKLQRAGLALATLLGAAVSLDATAAISQLPREKVEGVASYVSGGVSDEAAQAFKRAFRDYPLVIKLYEHEGKRDVYTADAQVRITDAHGHVVLDQKADGPFMLVRLPAGHYRVSAELGGHALPQHQVHITDHGHASSVFVFPPNAG
jgi:hypothetical protein